jgi:hypothetical protein
MDKATDNEFGITAKYYIEQTEWGKLKWSCKRIIVW